MGLQEGVVIVIGIVILDRLLLQFSKRVLPQPNPPLNFYRLGISESPDSDYDAI